MRYPVLLAGAIAVMAAGSSPARAETVYPWCLITSGLDGGVYSCGYVSEQQCRWARTGTEMCVINPRYQPSAEPPYSRTRRPRS
jgi:hypothetical protein